jgi:DNA-binding NtrC family response regulator
MKTCTPSILALDDHAAIRQLYKAYLGDIYDLDLAANAKEALEKATMKSYDLYLVDLIMPGVNGIQFIRELRKLNPESAVIVISQTDEIDLAVEAFREHPMDFLRKPVQKNLLLSTVQRNLELRKLKTRIRHLSDESSKDSRCPEPVWGISPVMDQFREKIRRIGESGLSGAVLITGETGSGKEVSARQLHRWSLRKKGPFIAVNCGLLTKELAASELLGIERGVATGVEAREGKFALANGGTLFLDEIGELPLEVQPVLLRVLQERRFMRVGGLREESVDVAVIAATNKDLAQEVRAGRFREDLFYRICAITVRNPPLRDHADDIPFLIDHLYRRHGGSGPLPLTEDEIEAWKRLSWPGNIRQLENALLNRLIEGESFDPLMNAEIFHPQLSSRSMDANLPASMDELIGKVPFEAIKMHLFQSALHRSEGNFRKAARLLGIPSSTLWDFINNPKKRD